MSYTEKDVEARKKLEKELLGFANDYILKEWEIPALIGGNILKKCGYFRSMPHQLTSVGFIKENAIGQVIAENDISSNDVSKSEYYLTPAACIHLYPMLEKEQLENVVITTHARVYRYENAQFEKGQRLWDFAVREFVAVGIPGFVHTFLKDFQNKSLELCKKLGIEAKLSASNDHFYPTKENSLMQKIQKANNLKIELIADSGEKPLAIASYNYHNYHFSKPFHFDKNEKVVTGCVGFGLDRWLNIIR